MPATQRLDLPALNGGINKAIAPWLIADTDVLHARDVFLDTTNNPRRRGSLRRATSTPIFADQSPGLVQTFNPAGSHRVAILLGDGSSVKTASFFDSTYGSVGATYTWPFAFTKDAILQSAPALRGGTWIGLSTRYDTQSTLQGLALWRGGDQADGAGGATITATRGSKTVTGSAPFNGTVVPGMHLFANPSDHASSSCLIGVVQSVSGDTITLEQYALASVAAGSTAAFTALRGLSPRVASGTLTCATSSATVNGGDTRFKDQLTGTVTNWRIFRARDYTFVGDVSSVASNIQLTLGASAAVAMDDEFYIAIDLSVTSGNVQHTSSNWTAKAGFLTAVFAGRQWYANLNRVGDTNDYYYRLWFSSPLDAEALDLTEADGDYITITGGTEHAAPILGLYSTYSGLVIFKHNEVLLLTGDDPTNFSIRSLYGQDGCLSPMTVTPTEGGCIWAGRKGVYRFDGTAVDGLSGKLGDDYQAQLIDFDPETDRAYAFYHRNHYVLHIGSVTGETLYATAPTLGVEYDNSVRELSSLKGYWKLDDKRSTYSGHSTTQHLASSGPVIGSGSHLVVVDDAAGFSPTMQVAGPEGFEDIEAEDLYLVGTLAGNQTPDTTLAADAIYMVRFHNPHAGTLSKIQVYLDGGGSGAGSQVAKALVYSDDAVAGTPRPLTLAGTSAEVTVTSGDQANWIPFTFASEITLTANTDYWFGIKTGATASNIRVRSSATGDGARKDVAGVTYTSAAPTTWDSGGDSAGTEFVIYGEVIATKGSLAYQLSGGNYATAATLGNTIKTAEASGGIVGLDWKDSWTVDGWFYLDSLPPDADPSSINGVAMLLGNSSISASGTSPNGLLVDGSGRLYCARTGGVSGFTEQTWFTAQPDYWVRSAAGVIEEGQWYHIMATASNELLAIYVNGMPVAVRSNHAVPTYSSTGPVQIGGLNFSVSGTDYRFETDGRFHRCFVANAALPQEGAASRANVGASDETDTYARVNETHLTLAFNLFIEAWTTLSNCRHSGGVIMPAETGHKPWILVNDDAKANVCDIDALWGEPGDDEIIGIACFPGPNLYIQSKSYDADQSTWVKVWKGLLAKIKVEGGDLTVESVPSFETRGFRADRKFEAPAQFDPREGGYRPTRLVLFWKRGTHIAFRFHEGDDTAITDVQLGPMTLLWKPMRAGRKQYA